MAAEAAAQQHLEDCSNPGAGQGWASGLLQLLGRLCVWPCSLLTCQAGQLPEALLEGPPDVLLKCQEGLQQCVHVCVRVGGGGCVGWFGLGLGVGGGGTETRDCERRQ